MGRLFGESDPVKRGKAIEGLLNRLFALYDISVREAFVLRVDGQGIVEQIDGVVELDGELYLVEVKWWHVSLGPGDVAQHLVRVFNRGHARGIIASGFPSSPFLSFVHSSTAHSFQRNQIADKVCEFLWIRDAPVAECLSRHRRQLASPSLERCPLVG